MTEHEKLRRQTWSAVATAVAGAFGGHKSDVPGRWANAVLADFDKTFQEPTATSTPASASPRVTRTFCMTQDEIEQYKWIDLMYQGIDPDSCEPRSTKPLQVYLLKLFAERGAPDARMPFAVEVSTTFGRMRYMVSECQINEACPEQP